MNKTEALTQQFSARSWLVKPCELGSLGEGNKVSVAEFVCVSTWPYCFLQGNDTFLYEDAEKGIVPFCMEPKFIHVVFEIFLSMHWDLSFPLKQADNGAIFHL